MQFYSVYRDNTTWLQWVTNPTFTDTNVNPGETHSYQINAGDWHGNWSAVTSITFTPGATANQGTIALRQGTTSGLSGTLLPALSYPNVDRDGSLAFASASLGTVRPMA